MPECGSCDDLYHDYSLTPTLDIITVALTTSCMYSNSQHKCSPNDPLLVYLSAQFWSIIQKDQKQCTETLCTSKDEVKFAGTLYSLKGRRHMYRDVVLFERTNDNAQRRCRT
jgi:hypothetical protein